MPLVTDIGRARIVLVIRHRKGQKGRLWPLSLRLLKCCGLLPAHIILLE